MSILLQPASGRPSRVNYQKTIESEIPLDQIATFLSVTERAELQTSFPENRFRIWGITPGNGRHIFTRLRLSDRVFFYGGGRYFDGGRYYSTALVGFKTHNAALADHLWGKKRRPDGNLESFEYVYFIKSLSACDIPEATPLLGSRLLEGTNEADFLARAATAGFDENDIRPVENSPNASERLDWTESEVDATIVDYLEMLHAEQSGLEYSKSAHRRVLLQKLNSRTEGAVELKHQNISAVLQNLGFVWIDGYKPRSNYQALLEERVVEILDGSDWVPPESKRDLPEDAGAPNTDVLPLASIFSTPPQSGRGGKENPKRPREGRKIDYAARDAKNRTLGRAGEELVVTLERRRLIEEGHPELAANVVHVSQVQGDGLGHDVLTFDADTGNPLFIEVKTTRASIRQPFFLSASELEFAREKGTQFAIYRVYLFGSAPRVFVMRGDWELKCDLKPVLYEVHP